MGLGRVFVADTGADHLTILDELSCSVIGALPVDDAPSVVVVDELSGRVYVASTGGNSVAAFDGRSGQALARVSMPGLGYPQGMAVDCSEDRLFVAYTLSPKHQSVAVLDGRDMQTVFTISLEDVGVPGSMYALAMDESSGTLYVSTSDALFALDSTTGRVLQRMPGVGAQSPFGLSLGRDTQQIFAVDLEGGPVVWVRGQSER